MKSAYYLATQLHGLQQPPIPEDLTLKKKVWRLKTAPKIQHFLWKLLSKILLPTGENLRRRHITNNSLCKCCYQEEESADHLFFRCYYAQAMWRASGLPLPVLLNTNATIEEKLEGNFQCNLDQNLTHIRQLPLWILWRLWKSRNILTFQQKQQPWPYILRLARDDANEWIQAEEYLVRLNPQSDNNRPQHQRGWIRPARHWLKCNYDASFTNETTDPQAGWILRDKNGVYKGTNQAKGVKVQNALESECQGLIQAMQHCWIRGYKRIIFEGDCKELTQILNGSCLNFGVHNWIRDIRHWKTKFEEVKFQWIQRVNNRAADQLSKSPMPRNSTFVHHFYVPHVLTNLLHEDYCMVLQH